MRVSSSIVGACGAVVFMGYAIVQMPAQTITTKIDIAKTVIGTPPADFEFGLTGEGELGQWVVVSDPTTATGQAIEHVSVDRHEDRFPLAIYTPLALENVRLTVRFKIISGTMLSAGMAVGVRDHGNYYSVSASALEQRVDLSLFANGHIKRLESLDADIVRGRWYTLGLHVNDDHFTVSLDGKPLFTAFDRSPGRTATSPSGRRKIMSRDLTRLKSVLSRGPTMRPLSAPRTASADSAL
jgi:hypothetical protein